MATADEEIRIEISIEAQKATENITDLRQNMETFKAFAKNFAKDTGDTLDVAFSSLKKVNLDKLNKDLKNLKAELSALNKVKAAQKPTEEIERLEAAIIQTTKKIRDLKEASVKGLGESKKEAREYVRVLESLKKIDIAATTRQIKEQSGAIKETKIETEQVQGGIRGWIANLKNLGGVAQFVFGTVLGVGAIQAMRKLIEVFKEAITASLEFQQGMFTLEVAIRGLQRMGLDTSIEGWTQRLADLKKQFPIFPRQEFVDAASLAALMTREFGFTEAKIADLVRLSAILAEITGKDLQESVRGITFAIGSGYFESLQRAGINISRAVVKNEALAQGYEGVYNELEPVIRAQVTYNVIQKNLAAIQEDAGKIVDTTTGRVRELNAAWKDFLIVIGSVITDTDEAKDAVEGLVLVVKNFTELIELYSEADLAVKVSILDAIFGPNYQRFIETLPEFNRQLGIFNDRLVKTNAAKPREPILGDFLDLEGLEDLQEFNIGGVTFSEEEYQEIVDATQDLVDEIAKIEEDGLERRQDIIDDFQQDSVDSWEKHNQKLLDLAEDLVRRLSDIDVKSRQRIEDEIANNAFRVSEVIKKAAFRREDAERKFRERELNSERKFQEKLRQLRENFLLNLEDAVRERDARQIIRLTRQFNLRREQMIREGKLGKKERGEAFQEELRQIERQKEERLRQLAIEHQRRLDSIALQSERERAQARLDFERRQQAERERFEREKEDRKERLGEQLQDLDNGIQERINKIIEGLQKEYNLTEPQLDAISKLYENAYGPDGRIDRAIAYTLARIAQLAAWMNMLRTSMGTVPDPIRTEDEYSFAGGQAKGGTIVARKPTVAIFGEAGPEVAEFTPLNKLDSNPPTASMGAGQMTRSGKLRLELLLSPDLEAKIIDDTLGEIADVNFTIERARK